MSRKVKQLKSGILYLGATLIDSVVPFVTLPIFSRILSVDDYGSLALAQVYAVIACGVACLGLNTAYNRNYFEYYEDKKKTGELFFSTISFVAFLCLLVGILTFCFKDNLSQLIIRSPHHGNLLLWSFVGMCLINLRMFFLVYLRNLDRPKQYVANTLLLSVLNLAISIYFVVVLKIGVMGVVLGQVISAAIVLSGLCIQFLNELPWGWNQKLLIDGIKIGAPTVPMVFFGFLSNHFDKYMIGLLTTVGGVGVYSVGQKLALVIFTMMTSLQNVFSPRVYQRMFEKTEASRAAIGRYLLPFIYIIVLFALSISLFSEEIIWLFVPPQFYGAVDIITLLSLFYAILFFAKVNGDQLIFVKKTYLTTFLIIGAGLLNVVCNIPFILKWGAVGAASATLLSRSLAGVVIFKTAQRYYRIEWPAREIIMIFAVLFISSFSLLGLRYLNVVYSLRLSFKILSIAFYLYTGYLSGLFSKENVGALLSLVMPKINLAPKSST